MKLIRFNTDLLKISRKGKLQNFRFFLVLGLTKNREIVNIMNTCFLNFNSQFNDFNAILLNTFFF